MRVDITGVACNYGVHGLDHFRRLVDGRRFVNCFTLRGDTLSGFLEAYSDWGRSIVDVQSERMILCLFTVPSYFT